jgi:hypothetical protein
MLDFCTKTSGDFFCAPKQFPAICVSIFHSVFAIKIHEENPHTISHKEFQELDFKQAKFRAKKERNVLVEMGILGDFFKRFV